MRRLGKEFVASHGEAEAKEVVGRVNIRDNVRPWEALALLTEDGDFTLAAYLSRSTA